VSLRERKKERTREAISTAAIELFVEHGFDAVSVSQVAEASEVSRRTLFAYFPTKEDLVVHRVADHETESARVVRERPAGQLPLAALRDHFLDRLRARDPITGLCDLPEVIALVRLLLGTPALLARMQQFIAAGEHALAEAQISGVQWTLSMGNQTRMAAGVSADDAYPEALALAEEGFRLLADGLTSADL